MNMKQYMQPWVEFVKMNPVDILTLSGADNQVQYDDEGQAHESWF